MSLSPQEMRDWWNCEVSRSAKSAIISNVKLSDEDFFATGLSWLSEFVTFAGVAFVELGGEKALDFGCGIGRMTRALATRYSSVTGIDISDGMIARARELNASPALNFLQVLEPPWPLDDRSVDLAFSTIAIQHIARPHNGRAIGELFRISRDLVLFDLPSHKLAADDPDPPGIFFFSFDEVRQLASENGFEMLALRNMPATETRHYQYLYRRLR